jgi:hypothetical protein
MKKLNWIELSMVHGGDVAQGGIGDCYLTKVSDVAQGGIGDCYLVP